MIERLTPRERQVLQRIVAGRTTRQVAAELGIAYKTAACHRQRLLDKCAAGNTAELVQRAILEPWILGFPPAASEEHRIERMFADARRCRKVLSEAVARSRVLRGECQDACAEVRRSRTILRQNCKELAAAVRANPDPYFFSTSTAKA